MRKLYLKLQGLNRIFSLPTLKINILQHQAMDFHPPHAKGWGGWKALEKAWKMESLFSSLENRSFIGVCVGIEVELKRRPSRGMETAIGNSNLHPPQLQHKWFGWWTIAALTFEWVHECGQQSVIIFSFCPVSLKLLTPDPLLLYTCSNSSTPTEIFKKIANVH